jgi:spermidine/putrescine transport system permease protein
VPVGFLVAYSFYAVDSFDFVPEWNLDNYHEALTGEVYRSFYVRTLGVAAVTSLLVVLISFPFAFVISYVLPKRRQLLYFLVLVSLFGGYLVRIFAWRNILGREGFINESLERMGLIDQPLDVLLNSRQAVVLALVNFLIPLGVLPIFAAMQNVSASQIEAARDLGATRFQAAVKIVLPLTSRGVGAAFAFTFIAAACDWVTPQLLGGTGDQMIGNQIAYQFGGGLNWPLGAALAIVLVVSVGLLMGLMQLVIRWVSR